MNSNTCGGQWSTAQRLEHPEPNQALRHIKQSIQPRLTPQDGFSRGSTVPRGCTSAGTLCPTAGTCCTMWLMICEGSVSSRKAVVPESCTSRCISADSSQVSAYRSTSGGGFQFPECRVILNLAGTKPIVFPARIQISRVAAPRRYGGTLLTGEICCHSSCP